MKDRISINRLQVPIHLGVPDEERALAQTVEITLHLYLTDSLFGTADEIEKTVNYYEVSQDVLKIAAQRPRKLIELLNEDIARTLLSTYPLERVEIRTDKFIIPNTASVSVEMTLNRNEL